MSIKYQCTFLRRILYLHAVIQAGSIREASDKNGIKPSNMSREIKLLEKTLGQTLFSRNAHGITPTREALKIGERADEIENIIQNLDRPAVRTKNPVRLFLAEGLEICSLQDFKHTCGFEIFEINDENQADVLVLPNRPIRADDMISVQNTVGIRLRQTIWVCAVNTPNALKTARFIIGQIHAR